MLQFDSLLEKREVRFVGMYRDPDHKYISLKKNKYTKKSTFLKHINAFVTYTTIQNLLLELLDVTKCQLVKNTLHRKNSKQDIQSKILK